MIDRPVSRRGVMKGSVVAGAGMIGMGRAQAQTAAPPIR